MSQKCQFFCVYGSYSYKKALSREHHIILPEPTVRSKSLSIQQELHHIQKEIQMNFSQESVLDFLVEKIYNIFS